MKKQVKRIFTLSKYYSGMHNFDVNSKGNPSFAESLSGLTRMINSVYTMGIPLGTKIEVTMKVKPKVKTGKK